MIKKSVLKFDNLINTTEKLNLHGINDGNKRLQTIGFINLEFYSKYNQFRYKVHVIDSISNIPYDGILGSDFLKDYKFNIDYSRKEFQIPLQNSVVFERIPFNFICEENNSFIYLLPRTETLVEINILNPEIREGLIPEMIIKEGVYLSNAITRVNNESKAYATIINTKENPVLITRANVLLETIPHHVMLCSPKQNFSIDRKQLVRSKIRDDHLNDEEKESLFNICNSFADIFFLEGDTLSSTDAIRHQIITNSDKPVASKTYRYPHIHKEEVNRQIDDMLKQNIIRHSKSPWSAPLWVVPKKLDSSGNRKWRVVIDYRKLNDVTVGDSYPLPNISEILDQLGSSKYFTTLDLASGFHQIEMEESDKCKTAFCTPKGHFEFNRMSFGLKNAPATFQRMMNNVLTGLDPVQCFVYLDDIVVYASSLKDHEIKLRNIFERLRQNNLKIQPDKCEFLRKEVCYLGHVITENGVKPNPDKIKVIEKFPRPTNQKEIKGFLGLVGYYRKFIENFSKISKPLTGLLRKDYKFEWNFEQEDAFNVLRNKLISTPILQYPDFSKEFIVTTDASKYAIGAILSQGELGKDLPIAFASRTLNRAESNYNTTELELLAIIWAVGHFRPYIYGRKFVIVTDHRPLTWLFNCKDPSSKLVRWRLKLEEYDYEIRFKPGRVNSNVDCLSRIRNGINTISNSKDSYEDYIESHYKSIKPKVFDFVEENSLLVEAKNDIAYLISADFDENNKYLGKIMSLSEDFEEIKLRKHELFSNLKTTNNLSKKDIYHCVIKSNYWEKASYKDFFYTIQNLKNTLEQNNSECISLPNFEDDFNRFKYEKLKEIIQYVFRNSKIKIIIHSDKIREPLEEEIPVILEENHISPHSGHSGYFKTYERIRSMFRWKGMKKTIKNFIKKCESCQKNKTVRKNYKAPMEITTTSSQPFERLSLDVVGPLPITEKGNQFILTMQDDLTKYSQAYCIPHHTSQQIAECLVHFISYMGIPKTILSDQGSDFLSKLMSDVSKLFRIKQIKTTAYHPQSNGALERSHSTLKDYLKHYINEYRNDWDNWIHLAMFSYNTSIHSTTKYSPHELVFGYKPTLPSSLLNEPEFRYTYEDYVDQLKYRLNKSFEIAKNNILNSKEKSKLYYDRNVNEYNYKIGDMVLLKDETNKLGKKLSKLYLGPYEIIRVFRNKNAQLRINNKKLVRVHFNRLKPYI